MCDHCGALESCARVWMCVCVCPHLSPQVHTPPTVHAAPHTLPATLPLLLLLLLLCAHIKHTKQTQSAKQQRRGAEQHAGHDKHAALGDKGAGGQQGRPPRGPAAGGPRHGFYGSSLPKSYSRCVCVVCFLGWLCFFFFLCGCAFLWVWRVWFHCFVFQLVWHVWLVLL